LLGKARGLPPVIIYGVVGSQAGTIYATKGLSLKYRDRGRIYYANIYDGAVDAVFNFTKNLNQLQMAKFNNAISRANALVFH